MTTRGPLVLLVSGLISFGLVIAPFTAYMRQSIIEEKLGYVPNRYLLKLVSADQKELVGAWLTMKTLMYFGGVLGKAEDGRTIREPPDMKGMSGLLHDAVQLDPYNKDAYYFAQSFLTWDARQYRIANELLDYGMKYRTWDWSLPFYAGFNSAYFLKDYAKAAEYYRRAGELSGQEQLKGLAGRFMRESGQTELAITYLTTLAENERNQAVKQNYQKRLAALREVRRVEAARDRYREINGVLPSSVAHLEQSGLLNPKPVDPYGGAFYLEPDGRVATTSERR